ncbi:TPA: hypothetical protein ACS9WW_004181 [Salmonella enterica subsp. enterica serovar Muenchen]
MPAPGVPVGPGDKVKQDADRKIASGLQGWLDDIRDTLDKATQCSFGRACSSDDGEKQRPPNLGKGLTDREKVEAGGAGSGTPGGWEPQDEEHARNAETVTQQQQSHFDELSKLYDKGDPSQNLTIDGQTIRQGNVSNNYGTTKVFESQNLTDQQIHNYAQQLAGDPQGYLYD